MANKVDPDLVQRYLALQSVRIRDDMKSKNMINDLMYPGQILTLDAVPTDIPLPVPPGLKLNSVQSSKARHVEHQLLSLNPIPSVQAGMELFANSAKQESINFSYSIHNSIMLDMFGDLYYFNIDEANNSAAAHGKFFISKFTLNNKAKDSFTAKSNYVLTLNIAFTYFDDLLEENVVCRSFLDPNKTIKLPLIKILYKNFDVRTDIPTQAKQIKDSTGLYFNQVLKLKDDRFKNTVGDIGSDVNRTLHMTFYKHQFNVFQNQEPLIYSYENELVIDYVSYEADITERLITSQFTQGAVSNLYDLLDEPGVVQSLSETYYDKNLTSLGFALDAIEKQKKELTQAQLKLNCIDIYESLSDADKKSSQLAKFGTKNKKDIQAEIKSITDLMAAYKGSLDRTLIYYILSRCSKYKITADIEGDLQYQISRETWYHAIGWSGAATIGLALAGIGILAIATGGTALLAGQVLLSTNMLGAGAAITRGFTYDPTTYKAPEQLNFTRVGGKIDVQYAASNNELAKIINAQKIELALVDRILLKEYGTLDPGILRRGAVGVTVLQGGGSKELNALLIRYGKPGSFLNSKKAGSEILDIKKQISDTISALESGEVLFEDDQETVELPFILYGDLIKLIKKPRDANLLVICGGKLIPQNDDGTINSYMNLAHMPISLNKLWTFLQDRIAKNENRSGHYNSEQFLRDTHDVLLKGAMRSADAVLDAQYKHYIPGNMYMNSGVHSLDDNFKSMSALYSLNLFDDATVSSFKKTFIKSKNIVNRSANNKNLAKVYTIGTSEDMRYFDYYEGYRGWALEKKKQRTNYASNEFQEYMINKHLTPCVLIRYTANDETMLKKKNVSFSRIDNQNLTAGNIIDGQTIFRLPYSFSSEFKPYVSFFLDIGSLIFISPPQSRSEVNINTFGFGGLYLIKESKLEYTFQKLEAGAPTLPNEDAKLTLGGYMLTHGDAIKTKNTQTAVDKLKAQCIELASSLSPAPAAAAAAKKP